MLFGNEPPKECRDSYGIPYKGSKGRLAKDIVRLMKPGKRLVDLFGGGGAITHCASETGKRSSYHYNEFDPEIYNLFLNITDLLKDIENIKRKWISREEFMQIREKENKTPLDNLILLCYSFGNNGNSYMYGKTIEERKHHLHDLHFKVGIDSQEKLNNKLKDLSESRVFFDLYKIYFEIDFDEYQRIEYFRTKLYKYIKCRIGVDGKTINEQRLREFLTKKKNKPIERHEYLQQLESLESLQSLQSLQSLERLGSLESLGRLGRLERLEILERLEATISYSNLSREQVELKEGDIIYCDPPYQDTEGYKIGGIDYDAFREFVRTTPYPCYVSSYKGPDDFVCFETNKGQLLSRGGITKSNAHTERVYWNGR